jgi:hypothetical protein
MKVTKVIFASVFLTILLLFIKNESNFNDYIIIPLITSLVIKYTFGDFDIGYQWSKSDIFYWVILIVTSVIIIKIVKRQNF